jgi:tetratricopeptide (TPR) repeat protein
MKTILSFFALVTLSISQFAYGQGDKEAAKLAREAVAAANDQDWDKAVESARKAAQLDRKFESNLAAALQQRGFAAANERRLPEAITDFTEAIKLKPNDAGAYERRAAVEVKMNDLEKAQADYTEAIRLKPNDTRFYNYRSFILESKGDLKGSMADTEKVLKMDKKNAEALSRKTRLETRIKIQQGNNPSPAATAPPPPKKH